MTTVNKLLESLPSEKLLEIPWIVEESEKQNLIAEDDHVAARPSKQVVTIWPVTLNDRQWRRVVNDLLLIRPNAVCLHGNPRWFTTNGTPIVDRLRRALGDDLEIWVAITGDWDTPKPGYADWWLECAVWAVRRGIRVFQMNCEVAWKSRPKGSARASVMSVFNGLGSDAAKIELGHTTYGAVAGVDFDPSKPGHQGFGGHGTYPMREFCGEYEGELTPIKHTNFQVYWSLKDGEHLPRGRGLKYADAYRRSIVECKRRGLVAPSVVANVYLQMYDARVDELCIASESYNVTQWWALFSRSDDAGRIACAVMSELYRRQQTIEQFQRAAFKPENIDRLVGPKTYAALLPDAPWKHPQAA